MKIVKAHDDHFGIIKELKKLYKKLYRKLTHSPSGAFISKDILSDDERLTIWMRQFLPPAYYASKGAIHRHLEQIKAIQYQPDWVWIKRGDQYQCAIITTSLKAQIDHQQVEIPTYFSIEEEKKRWQATPNYNKEEGFSSPIEEEVVQLVIHK